MTRSSPRDYNANCKSSKQIITAVVTERFFTIEVRLNESDVVRRFDDLLCVWVRVVSTKIMFLKVDEVTFQLNFTKHIRSPWPSAQFIGVFFF